MYNKHGLISKKKKESFYYILVLMIPLLIIGTVLFIRGIYPFGDNTLIYHDMQYQYTDFFMWFHNVLHGKDTLEYSFFAGIGGNTIALVAYYLASPFNLLFYFFPIERVAEFLTLLIGLKLVLCSFTAYIYIKNRFNLDSIYGVLIAVSYSLMGYNILQCSNIMWLDGVIILPILALGIYHNVWKERNGIYFLALFYGIFSNWYIGYMLCLFAVLYFLFECALYYLDRKKINLKNVLNKLFRFVLASILGVCASGFLFVPQTLHMLQSGEGFDWSIFHPSYSFPFLDGFRDLFLEPDKLTLAEANPPIYIGTLVVLLIVVLLLSKNVVTYKKALSSIFLIGFMFIFDFKPLNYVFTLFKIPSSHAYRYAFIYSFFMIVVAAMCVKEIKEFDTKTVMKAACIVIGAALIFDLIKPYEDTKKVYISCAIVLVMSICLILKRNGNYKNVLRVNLILISCLMLEFGIKMYMEFENHTQSASWYEEYNQRMANSVSQIESDDTTSYRMDKAFSRGNLNGHSNGGLRGGNESLAFGYSSLSQYTSTDNVNVAELLKTVGYSGDTTMVPYIPVLPMDSFFGNKYIYSPAPIYGCETAKENVLDGINLYYNPYALPLGFAVADIESAVDFGNNAFENHEIIYNAALGHPAMLYTYGDITSQNTDSGTWTEWNIKVNKTGPLYCYLTNGSSNVHLFINDEYSASYVWYDHPVIYLGEYSQDDIVKVKVVDNGGGYLEDYGMIAATLDMQHFETAIDSLKKESCQISAMEDKQLIAEYNNAEAKTILLTIPYEDGWKLKINGEKTAYRKALNSLISFDMPAGGGKIELTYSLPGKSAGIIISLMAFILFGIWEYGAYRKKKR